MTQSLQTEIKPNAVCDERLVICAVTLLCALYATFPAVYCYVPSEHSSDVEDDGKTHRPWQGEAAFDTRPCISSSTERMLVTPPTRQIYLTNLFLQAVSISCCGDLVPLNGYYSTYISYLHIPKVEK